MSNSNTLCLFLRHIAIAMSWNLAIFHEQQEIRKDEASVFDFGPIYRKHREALVDSNFFSRLLNVLKKNDQAQSVRLEAAIEFDQGIILGQIYKISASGFQMITDCNCDDIANSRNISLVNIEGKYFPVFLKIAGLRRIDGKFRETIDNQELNGLLKKSFVSRISK